MSWEKVPQARRDEWRDDPVTKAFLADLRRRRDIIHGRMVSKALGGHIDDVRRDAALITVHDQILMTVEQRNVKSADGTEEEDAW